MSIPLIEGIAFGAMTFFSFTMGRAEKLTVAAQQIDESTLIPVGAALVVGGAMWYAGRKFQALLDTIRSLKASIRSLPCMNQIPGKGKPCDYVKEPDAKDDESTL